MSIAVDRTSRLSRPGPRSFRFSESSKPSDWTHVFFSFPPFDTPAQPASGSPPSPTCRSPTRPATARPEASVLRFCRGLLAKRDRCSAIRRASLSRCQSEHSSILGGFEECHPARRSSGSLHSACASRSSLLCESESSANSSHASPIATACLCGASISPASRSRSGSVREGEHCSASSAAFAASSSATPRALYSATSGRKSLARFDLANTREYGCFW